MNIRILAVSAAALFAAMAVVSVSSGAGAQTAAEQVTVLSGAEQSSAVAQANRVLNATRTMQGRFVQISPDGSRANGAFYLQRPGRLRFEYDPPATLLIVSDGNNVAMRDRALRTTDRTPLRSTPLNLILRQDVNLARDARITRVARFGQWLMISARDRSGQTDGMITLHFYGPDAQLRSWDVIDAAGARTRIALSGVTAPASLDRALFRLEDMLEERPRRPQ